LADNFTAGIGSNGAQSDADYEKVMVAIRRLNALAADRTFLNLQCEDISALIMPSHRGTFQFMSTPVPYDTKTDQQVDATGMLALGRFMGICDSLLTPKNQTWHSVGASDDYVMKDRATRLWFYNATRRLFKARYSPLSNFVSQNQMIWTSLGAYGNGVLYIDQYYDFIAHEKAFRYIFVPFGEIYLEHNHQGVVNGFIRIIRYTAQQAMGIPGWAEKLKDLEIFAAALKVNSMQKFIFLQRVCPRDLAEYDPSRMDYKGKPYSSYYMHMDSRTLLTEGGYNTLPIAATSYITAPGEMNGRSIAMEVLPSLKTLNEQKKTFLKVGHRRADPVLLLPDDGLVGMNMKPGSQNPGGMSSEGKTLVGTLPIGDAPFTKEMMGQEIDLINDAFLIKLFSIAADPRSGTTATEVIERINEKGILIAPTLGRQEGYLGLVIHREMNLGSEMKIFDPMPPRLVEAIRGGAVKGVHIQYDSPLSRASRAQEAAGFMRTVEMAKELYNVTGDPSVMYPFAFDRAIPAIASIQGSPEPWMATKEEIAQKVKAGQQSAAQEQQIKAAPGAAQMIKAQASAQKAGGGQQQQPGGVAPAQRGLMPGPGGQPQQGMQQ
jgi:hypothetical protein